MAACVVQLQCYNDGYYVVIIVDLYVFINNVIWLIVELDDNMACNEVMLELIGLECKLS